MNPILQAMNRNPKIDMLNSMLGGRNPEAVFNQLITSNPQFRQFVEANKNLSPEQIAQNFGVTPDLIRMFMST